MAPSPGQRDARSLVIMGTLAAVGTVAVLTLTPRRHLNDTLCALASLPVRSVSPAAGP